MAPERSWLEPPAAKTKRAAGRIVAKGTAKNVEAIANLGDRIAIAHHEGLSNSPGGITVLRRHDFTVVTAVTHAFGPLDTTGATWLASGPLWRGRHASLRLLDPAALATVDTLPLCRPFVRVDEQMIVAHTPPMLYAKPGYDVDPAELRAAAIELPPQGGLVVVDLDRRTLRLLVAASQYDEFRAAELSPDRAIVYAASSFGRVVAVRIADGELLWQRAAVANVVIFALHALALSPDGTRLALAGSGNPHDLLVLDAATGRELQQRRICPLLDRARVTPRPNARIEALGFHPAGWLAAATSAGAIAELHTDGRLSAFKASGAGIEAFAFVDDGRSLLVGGREPQLRLWPVDL
ncbi:MAG TPA: hypothetical protein VFQ53_19705 [Kofleriaceae bacterium]|nr:hypothetical protein [Kofleriaceae bacterium]